MRLFRRMTDDGHAMIFKSRVSHIYITIELHSPMTGAKILTTLSKEDGRRYAQWLLEKCKE